MKTITTFSPTSPEKILDDLEQVEEKVKNIKIILRSFVLPSKKPPYPLKKIIEECRKTRKEMWKEEYEGKI